MLKPIHYAAVQALLSHRTQTEAAEACKVPLRTLKRWIQREEFQAELVSESSRLWRQTVLRLKAIADKAVQRLIEELDSDKPSRGRIRAASDLLNHATKLHYSIELADRIEALEAKLLNVVDKR